MIDIIPLKILETTLIQHPLPYSRDKHAKITKVLKPHPCSREKHKGYSMKDF